jgi:hypothetical protein
MSHWFSSLGQAGIETTPISAKALGFGLWADEAEQEKRKRKFIRGMKIATADFHWQWHSLGKGTTGLQFPSVKILTIRGEKPACFLRSLRSAVKYHCGFPT